MNVLVACEFSGVVRDAFRARGHQAYSCDLLPGEGLAPQPYHIQADVNYVLNYPGRVLGGHPMLHRQWDLLIGHPPCTYMANSGARWLYEPGTRVQIPQRWADLEEAVKLIGLLWATTVPRVAIENPIMHKHARQRFGVDPTQIIQPWMFGHREMKATCLWLRGLPKLVPTDNVGPPPKDPIARRSWARVHRESPGPDRWKNRSRTLRGIAAAMAAQWG